MAALCVFLMAACITDYRRRKIPNLTIMLMLLTGLGYRISDSSPAGAASYLGTGLAISGLTNPLFRLGMLGGGDVKLFSVTAGYLSWTAVIYFLFYSAVFAAIISAIKIMKDRNARERLAYFCSYAMQAALTGEWNIYFTNETEKRKSGICLAGPVLLSILLHLGGAY